MSKLWTLKHRWFEIRMILAAGPLVPPFSCPSCDPISGMVRTPWVHLFWGERCSVVWAFRSRWLLESSDTPVHPIRWNALSYSGRFFRPLCFSTWKIQQEFCSQIRLSTANGFRVFFDIFCMSQSCGPKTCSTTVGKLWVQRGFAFWVMLHCCILILVPTLLPWERYGKVISCFHSGPSGPALGPWQIEQQELSGISRNRGFHTWGYHKMDGLWQLLW